jgi:Flp pilus assembly protein TadD
LFSGWVKAWSGEAEEAIARVNRAMEFSPNDPHLYSMRRAIGFAHFMAGRYRMAIEEANASSTSLQNEFIAVATVAASAGLLGQIEEGRAAMVRLLKLSPTLNAAVLRRRFPMQRDEDFRR